jgi:hypothetical protein
MVVLDGNFAVGCGPGTDYPYIHVFQCTLERTDAIKNEVLEPITFALAYRTVYIAYFNSFFHNCYYINVCSMLKPQ